MSSKQVLVPVAHGSESIETVTIVNVLRRAKIEVTLTSIESSITIDGSRGIKLVADTLYSAIAEQVFDMIVLPGGEAGAKALGTHTGLVEKLHAQRVEHRWIGAICAAPALVLAPHGLIDGKQATGYPAFRDALLHYVDQPVVVDGHTVTGQGPASAIAFALMLVEKLAGSAARHEVAAAMLTT
jgi:4-methyl-5(b-hydroxyethyl)-thiazole monophosphate biosynthesis